MTELELPLIINLIIFISLPFLAGLIALRLKLPRMIGYIISGMILGVIIHGSSGEFLPIFGNFGLILLLFTVGLEINVATLKRFGKPLLVIGLLQVLLTWVGFFIAVSLLGFDPKEAAVVGFAFSLSSTAIVSKMVQDRSEENSLLGGMTLGILLLQDIVVIPFMIVISSVGESGGFVSVATDVVFSLVKAGVILTMIYFLAMQIVPILFARVAKISRELLNLMTILFIFIFVAVFSLLGLSPAIAAFVAGMLIGRTLEHYQIFSQIRPMRDIFTILFFVFLGATIDLTQIVAMLPMTLVFVSFVMVFKFIVIASLFVYFRFHSKTAFSSGIMLAQVGEFAFIVLHQAELQGMLSEETYLFAIASTLVTIAISPILMDNRDKLYIKTRRFMKKHMSSFDKYISYRVDREPAHIDALSIKDHVVICGYGRVGSYIGRALTMAKVPFIAIDYNYRTVELQRQKGVNIIYGDPTDIDILDFAQVEYATALISAVPDAFSQEMIILNAKRLNPEISIMTRVALEKNQKRMKDLGAEIVIQPEFEAALSIVKKVLVGYNVSKKDIVGKIKRLKLEHGMA